MDHNGIIPCSSLNREGFLEEDDEGEGYVFQVPISNHSLEKCSVLSCGYSSSDNLSLSLSLSNDYIVAAVPVPVPVRVLLQICSISD